MIWKTSLCTATALWAPLEKIAVCCADAGMDGFDPADAEWLQGRMSEVGS